MSSSFYTIASVLIVSFVSLTGILLLGLNKRLMNQSIFVLISIAIGTLIGDVFIHILPEMAESGAAFFPTASLIVALGIILSFILEKILHWHHCHTLDHDHHHHQPRPMGLIALVGDAAHNILDGLLIAGSYLVDIPTGIATTIAVVLHEIPQEIGDYAILIHSGYSKSRALLFNLLTALTALLGAVAVLLLSNTILDLERYLLPLVAGNFLYIAVSDLLPELHKQTKVSHSVLQIIGVLLGIGFMFALTLLE
ncbi:hypothetical protein A3D88_04500 [Candidatus Peribacteria bacterium RIFCSPHIGHO2_02_FULL_52_16]|nr:MAG: hypothetical protein A2706_03130 [Candidatus Peribacteria bacterium RIFCSPHIGHO2_01_FULL_51_35]OGJ60866.1 MAG: hypothetical protein A3D88_04500 [Candidatus Peribacteria bacterium RIFCSPHIGHO2_02_FULL_52_16]